MDASPDITVDAAYKARRDNLRAEIAAVEAQINFFYKKRFARFNRMTAVTLVALLQIIAFCFFVLAYGFKLSSAFFAALPVAAIAALGCGLLWRTRAFQMALLLSAVLGAEGRDTPMSLLYYEINGLEHRRGQLVRDLTGKKPWRVSPGMRAGLTLLALVCLAIALFILSLYLSAGVPVHAGNH